MKKYLLLEEGSIIEKGDEFRLGGTWLAYESITFGKTVSLGFIGRRRIPEPTEPTWRKLSESAPVYPAWVSDGKEVDEKSAEDEAFEAYQKFLKDHPNSSIQICKRWPRCFQTEE
jgi:hypothetical protein